MIGQKIHGEGEFSVIGYANDDAGANVVVRFEAVIEMTKAQAGEIGTGNKMIVKAVIDRSFRSMNLRVEPKE